MQILLRALIIIFLSSFSPNLLPVSLFHLLTKFLTINFLCTAFPPSILISVDSYSYPTLILFLFFSPPLTHHLNLFFHPSSVPSSLTHAAQKGLLHLSPDVYQEMEASRKQGGSASGPGGSSSSSVNYITSKDMGSCSAPLPPGHPPYYSGSASSPSPTATMARELLLNGQAPTAESSLPMKGKNPALACGVSVQPAQQLDYLARIQGFQVRCKEMDMMPPVWL